MKKDGACARVKLTDVRINTSYPVQVKNTYLLITGHVGRKYEMFFNSSMQYHFAELLEKVSAKTKLRVIFYSRLSSIDLGSPYIVYVT
jgi:hypothetical protein